MCTEEVMVLGVVLVGAIWFNYGRASVGEALADICSVGNGLNLLIAPGFVGAWLLLFHGHFIAASVTSLATVTWMLTGPIHRATALDLKRVGLGQDL